MPLTLFARGDERAILDALLYESAMYRRSADYQRLLDFTARLRNFAPFNGMLLQLQKPGLLHAASAYDWASRFGRYPKKHARPLIIMWPFSPVAFVYDVADTEGADIPEDVTAFLTRGPEVTSLFMNFITRLGRSHIVCDWVDVGDGAAGSICITGEVPGKKPGRSYLLAINKNHSSATQFATMAHELAHLFLGHLGADARLGIPARRALDHRGEEIEAESVAYLVCRRNQITPKSQTYLANFVSQDMTTDDIDLYQVLRAAGQVEALLGLSRPTRLRPSSAKSR